jgi:hypothetical protein
MQSSPSLAGDLVHSLMGEMTKGREKKWQEINRIKI